MNFFTSSFPRPFALLLGLGLFASVQAQAQTRWTGTTSTDYSTPTNWNTGATPGPGTDVQIDPNGTVLTQTYSSGPPSSVTIGRQPVISGSNAAKSITVNTSASLTFDATGNLAVRTNITNDGVFSGITGDEGVVDLIGTAVQNVGGVNPISIARLVVSNPAGATLNTQLLLGQKLTLTGNLTVSSNLTLRSTPTRTVYVVNNPGVVVGTVTVQRAISPALNPNLGYRHYSSPVAATTVADFTTSGFTPVVNPQYNIDMNPQAVTSFPTVQSYDQAAVMLVNNSPVNEKGWRSPNSLADPLVVGRAYAVNIDGVQLVDFVGTLNQNNTYSVSMSRNAAGTLNDNLAGWQFLGNPFPAPIDFSLIDPLDMPDVAPTMYVFASTGQYAGSYRSYTNGVGINPTIPVGQGFFVRKNTPGTTSVFNFQKTQRLTTDDNTMFQRAVTVDTRPQVELQLSGAGTILTDYINVYFENGSTAGVDNRYDAVKRPNSNGLNMSTLTPSGDVLAIDGRPVPTGSLTVPMQVFAPASGTYTLQATKLLNMSSMHPYLHDIQQGTMIDLALQPSYTFALNAYNMTPRFELMFSAQVLATAPAALGQQVALYPNPANTLAYIELPTALGNQAITATLTDALGRSVRTVVLPAQGTAAHQLSLSGLKAGVYALQLNTSAGMVVKRVVVE